MSPTATLDDPFPELEMKPMHEEEEIPQCPQCGGWITDDGVTTGETGCCFWCQP